MKIGVVADTHSLSLPNQMLLDFKQTSLIIHAGDFCRLEDVKCFSEATDFQAVHGNMDEPKVKRLLPSRLDLILEGYKIGVYHGHGSANKVLDSVVKEFAVSQMDLVIFGHSHQPYNNKIGNTLYFNPGSPTDTITAPYLSYGMITLSSKGIRAKIIKVKSYG